ncbi:MAG: energy-coupling factor transporter transmembrane protein EcfT [Clostridia bacterium]|nr:energy-coupling factor transporter transmembrane protein EcfT [Clostridia bacterium]
MLNDVTFGQYYPAQSFVHKLDPRLKLLFLIAYIVMLFVAKSFYGLAVCFLILVITIIASRVPVGSVLRSIKGVIVILVFTSVLNVFFHGGSHLLWQWKFIKIYTEGIIFAVFLTLRLLFLVMGSAVLTLTTTPVNLTDGLESLLFPLTLIKIPVHVLALIMSIALRFIPTLMDETNRIISAQKARGANFESGNVFKRVKAIIPVLIPLLISAFRRAEELGDAMDVRCYSSGHKRTKYKKLKFGWRDLVGVLFAAILIAGVILLNIYGARIYPPVYPYLVI